MNIFIFIKIKYRECVAREKDDSNPELIKTWWALVLCVLCGLIFGLVYWNIVSLPKALEEIDIPKNPGRFIAERAYKDLEKLTLPGPRVTGTTTHDVFAVNYIQNAVNEIISKKSSSVSIELDNQISSGSYGLFGSTVYAFSGIQNIVAKLTSTDNPDPENFILLNSHLDTVIDSRGAADDGLGVVVMIETLRILSQLTESFKHGIIFVWNGSEKMGCQGAYSFITQHKWAHDIRVIINIDAVSAESKEFLFQIHKRHAWLMNYYKSAVPHPFATALFEEIWDSDVSVQFNTDYTVLGDQNNIPSMNFMNGLDGYRAYSTNDNMEGVKSGALQNTGDNILALIKALSNADEIENITDHESDEEVIYFDFMNWFLIQYPKTVGLIMNIMIGIGAIFIIPVSILVTAQKEKSEIRLMFREFGYVFLSQCLSLAIALSLMYIFGLFYYGIGRSMSWYSFKWFIVGLYYCPLWFCLTIGPLIYEKFGRKIVKLRDQHKISSTNLTKLFIHAQVLIVSVELIILTSIGIKSSYFVMLPILFYMLLEVVLVVVERECPFPQKFKISWLYAHLVQQIIPFIMISALTIIYLKYIVAAQKLKSSNPEYKIIHAVFISGSLLTGLLAPLVLLCRNKWLIPMLFSFISIFLMILMATPLGFPYFFKHTTASVIIKHSLQNYHNFPGAPKSGYMIQPISQYSSKYIDDSLGGNSYAEHDCSEKILCGYPYDRPLEYFNLDSIKYVPADPPKINRKVSLTLLSKTMYSSTIQRYRFLILGAGRVSLQISPPSSMTIIRLADVLSIPRPIHDPNTDRAVYNLVVVYGFTENVVPVEFEIDVEGNWDDSEKAELEIGISASYHNEENNFTEKFLEFMSQFPDYMDFQRSV